MMAKRVWGIISILGFSFLTACKPQAVMIPALLMETPLPAATNTKTSPTPMEMPSLVPFPSQTATLFPLPPYDLPIVSCGERHPSDDDLLLVVTAAFGLAPDYSPGDLVRLGDYLPGSVTLPDNLLQREAAESLGRMVGVMRKDGLKPTILSAFRSYYEQVITYNRWVVDDPANASQISALPGHSEHQLGTVVDFSSPGLRALTGDPSIKFSSLFSKTNEGIWLALHAQEYGFTLTNPPEAQPWTGLTYEPWHYRYVGVDLATYLQQSGYFLTEYLIQTRTTLPCVP